MDEVLIHSFRRDRLATEERASVTAILTSSSHRPGRYLVLGKWWDRRNVLARNIFIVDGNVYVLRRLLYRQGAPVVPTGTGVWSLQEVEVSNKLLSRVKHRYRHAATQESGVLRM
jgi:hypothetical protein